MDATSQRFLMCRPTYFAVDYAINPWMDPTAPVDTALASGSGSSCASTYLDLGHTVELIDPVPGLPDMVFAANGATVIDGSAMARAVPRPAARRRGPRLPGLVRGRRLRGVRPEARQRGRGRHPAGRRLPARRHRLPHRARRARRGAGGLRPPGDHPAAGRPALLPPGHRADRARRATTVAYLPGGVLARQPGGAAPALPGRGASPPWPTPRCSASTRSATAGTWCCPRRPPALAAKLRDRGYETIGGRPVRAAQGRRRTEVLHAASSVRERRASDRGRRCGPPAAVRPTPSAGPRTTTTRCRW